MTSDSQDRRSSLTQMLPQAGWGSLETSSRNPEGSPNRQEQIGALWQGLRAAHPHVDETAARNRFAILFFSATRLLGLGLPEGRKPTTWLRDQITAIRALPEARAIALLRQPALHWAFEQAEDGTPPVRLLETYLDLLLEADDPKFRADVVFRPEHLEELGRRRYALLMQHGEELAPIGTRGAEAIWGTIAELVVGALIDLTGKWPGRSVGVASESEGKEGGWGLRFFQTFAGMLTAPSPAPILPEDSSAVPVTDLPPAPTTSFDKAKVWRKALKRLCVQGRRPQARRTGRRGKDRNQSS